MSIDSQLATAPVTPGFHRATSTLSEFLGIEPRMMVDTIKKQCFPGMSPDKVSDAQLAAFISVANAMKLNPLIPGMLYAYESRNGGIVPVAGPDGVLKKLDEAIAEGKIESYECVVYPEDMTAKPTHAVAKIWRKGVERPHSYPAAFGEWFVGANPNWNTRPRHMIWLRALKQCARQVIHGVPYDEDDVIIGGMKNVTPESEQQPEAPARPAAPPRAKKGAAAVAENPKPAPAIDIQATPPATPTPAAELEKAPTPAEVKPAPEAAPKAEEPARAFLKDGETLECVVEVVEVSPLMINFKGTPTASVSVLVKGGFNTPNPAKPIYHIGGATGAEPDLKPLPIWAPGAKVRVSLLGKLTKAGNMMVTVSKAEALPANPAVDAD